MEVLIYLIFGVIGLVIGYHIRGVIFLAAIAEHPDKIIQMLEDIKKLNAEETSKAVPSGTEVEPECVNNYWYAYDKVTGQFLGQGSTLEDALSSASVRFPDKVFWCETLKSNLAKQA